MTDMQVPTEEWLRRSFELYRHTLSTLILAGLLAGIVSVLTLGVLLGPMLAGMVHLTLRLHDEDSCPPKPVDVFRGFDWFVPSVLYVLIPVAVLFVGTPILGVVPFLGPLLGNLVGVAVGILLAFSVPLIVDRNLGFREAVQASAEKVWEKPLGYVCFFLLASLGAFSGILLVVGILFTIPFGFCANAVAYRASFSQTMYESPLRSAISDVPEESTV